MEQKNYMYTDRERQNLLDVKIDNCVINECVWLQEIHISLA